MIIQGLNLSVKTSPGVIIHEFAHETFCKFFKVPIYEVVYFRFGNPAGYVTHGKSNHWYQDVIIAAGPFFLNSLLGALLAFPVVVSAPELETLNFVSGVIVWLSISIGMHAIPSTGDAKSMWKEVSGNKAPLIAK